MTNMKKKSRLEILRGKLKKMGECDEVHPEMPEDVAEAFIAELRFDPDCGAIAARTWRPDHRNEEPWIKHLLDDQVRLQRHVEASSQPRIAEQADDAPVN